MFLISSVNWDLIVMMYGWFIVGVSLAVEQCQVMRRRRHGSLVEGQRGRNR